MQTKLIILSIIGAGLLIGGAIIFSGGPDTQSRTAGTSRTGSTANVGMAVIENGVQYVDITARGGYSPKVTKAKAGVPTVIRMKTQNTYDCSTALVIPDIGHQSYLKQTGVEEIEVSLDKTQGTLRGMCSMAMYHFQIDFE